MSRPPVVTDSLVTSEVDFAAEGRQVGFLRVPHSVHRSAYGWIPVPVVSLKNGDGPTVLLMAGTHGDEYEWQIALSRLARDLSADDIRGRIIILSVLNAPAAEAGSRQVHACGLVYTYTAGVLELLKDIGDEVAENDLVGLIHHPDTPWQAPAEPRSPYAGLVLSKRTLAPVKRGVAAPQIAKDVQAPS